MKNNNNKNMKKISNQSMEALYLKYPVLKKKNNALGVSAIGMSVFAILIGFGLYDFMPEVSATVLPGFAWILRFIIMSFSIIPAQIIMLSSLVIIFLFGGALSDFHLKLFKLPMEIVFASDHATNLTVFIIACVVMFALAATGVIFAIKQRKIEKTPLAKSASIVSYIAAGLSVVAALVSIILIAVA